MDSVVAISMPIISRWFLKADLAFRSLIELMHYLIVHKKYQGVRYQCYVTVALPVLDHRIVLKEDIIDIAPAVDSHSDEKFQWSENRSCAETVMSDSRFMNDSSYDMRGSLEELFIGTSDQSVWVRKRPRDRYPLCFH